MRNDVVQREFVLSSTDADQAFYNDTQAFSRQTMEGVAASASHYFSSYQTFLSAYFRDRRDLKGLELGAGTCCLSLLLSALPFISRITCFDISAKKMADLVPLASQCIPSDPGKLEFHVGDFGRPLPFADESFDLVVFDGALHHSRSIWTTLAECRRILKEDGLLIAQREQYLGLLTYVKKLESLLATEEVKRGVSENAYFRKQYEFYFRACGLSVRFLPVTETRFQKLLGPLNGLFYSKWVILARKRPF